MMVLHRLNFFVKLALAMAVMTLAWLLPNPLHAAAVAVLVIGTLIVLRIDGIGGYLRGTLLLVAMVLVTWVADLWFQGEPLVAALPLAVRMASRLVATTGAFFFVMETSTPGSIQAAASAARLPATATLVLSLVFGIVPMLREEFERIADAQRARGMEIDGVPLHVRLRFALARGVPLLVHAVRMAHAISLSLTVNGHGAAVKRTTWRRVGLLVEDRLPEENTP